MSIHNFPDVSVSDANSGVPVLTPNTDPVNIPTKTYDLVISLGTDYHRFDRLLRWVDAYLKENPRLSCLVQHGHTAPIERGENVRLMPAGDLMGYYATASVVVVQGGPGSIQDARRTGAIPLVVPRRAEFDEVVDNHQVPFADLMEKRGHAVVVNSRAELFDKLKLALANPSLFRSAEPYVAAPEVSAEQLSEALHDLLTGRSHRTEGYVTRFKNAARAHFLGKREMARISSLTPNA